MARVIITGGSGFVGRAVARRLVQNGVKVCAVSRTGGPPASCQDEWTRSSLIDWAQLDCTDSEQMTKLIEDYKPTAYVHAVGALLEKSHYKSVIDPFTSLASLASMVGGGLGGGGRSSSRQFEDEGEFQDARIQEGTPDYNVINRDSLAIVADSANKASEIALANTKTPDAGQRLPFVFVSAFAAPPLVDQRYIESKREAEEILFSCNGLRPIVVRPGFLYSEEREWSMALAGMLQLASSAHQGPLVGVSSMVRNMLPPGLDMSFAVHRPLRVEMLADAIVQGIANQDCFGILEGSDIQGIANQANDPL